MILLSIFTQLAFAEKTEERVSEGTIIEGQSGDTACYLTIQTKDGSKHQSMADFDLCSPMYVGKYATFSWREVNILSADCEGDVDCGQSDLVWLIDRAKPQWTVSIKDNEDGTSVLKVSSGSHIHKIDVPLGGCSQEEKGSLDVFYKRKCSFAGSGGSIGLKHSNVKGLHVVLALDEEQGTKKSILWTEPTKE